MKQELKMSKFHYGTTDSVGNIADPRLIGKVITHRGNNKTYRITGFCWLGETDEWGFLHSEDAEAVVCCRPMRHLNRERYDW